MLLAGVAAWQAWVVRDRLTSAFDESLLGKARTLQALTDQEGGRIELDYEPAAFPEYERAEDPAYFQFWLDDGRSLLRSARADRDLERARDGGAGPRFRDAALPDGRQGRLVQIAFRPRSQPDVGDAAEDHVPAVGDAPGRGLVLVVAREREGLDAMLATLRWGLLAAILLAAALAAAWVWRSVDRGLRPLDQVAAQVRNLDAERLDRRVGLDAAPPAELAPIVEQLDALLERLERSFARQKRFAGNVAHELRTPIAELRAIAEVGRRWPADAEAVEGYFRDVAGIAEDMERVVADLLLLARCRAGVERVDQVRVDVDDALRAAWAPHEATAAERGVGWSVDVPRDAVLRTDASKLGILLGNLLGNAAAYATPGTAIGAEARRVDDRWVVEIHNAAAPLARAALERIAEPFWRDDPARAASDHAGLGLTVVAELAELLGLEIGFRQDRDGRFRARLSCPADPRAARSPVGAP